MTVEVQKKNEAHEDACFSLCREEADLIPRGARWVKSAVTDFLPEENALVTQEGETIRYKYLVVCPGLQINWSNVRLAIALFSSSRFLFHLTHHKRLRDFRKRLEREECPLITVSSM